MNKSTKQRLLKLFIILKIVREISPEKYKINVWNPLLAIFVIIEMVYWFIRDGLKSAWETIDQYYINNELY